MIKNTIRVLLLAMVVAGAFWINFEAKNSHIQARLFTRLAESLDFRVEPGKSDRIVFPTHGPYDFRLGYVQLPSLVGMLESRGMEVASQVRFNDRLTSYTNHGFYPPYHLKEQAGLEIFDRAGTVIFQMQNPRRIYSDFREIPELLTRTFVFIEDRNLLDEAAPKINPAVNWNRFAKAAALQVGEMLHLSVPSMGGSTLATQLEKYHHSSGGVTTSGREKLIQMISASVRTYQNGEETLPWRQQLLCAYVNSVPLAAVPGIGEIHGIGDGMYVWYDIEFTELNALLASFPTGDAKPTTRQAQVFKQLLSLMIGHRRPSHYFVGGREELATLTDSYLRVLAKAGIISQSLSLAAQTQSLVFRDISSNPPHISIIQNKGSNLIRNKLASLFTKSLYEVDRFDLKAYSTLDMKLQDSVNSYLFELRNPTAAARAGIVGKYLLGESQTADVGYSFTLFEKTDNGNRVRVQTDTTGLPLDINEGSKLELGSTAKLRTLATYLEIIAELHDKLEAVPLRELDEILRNNPDPLTRWVVSRLLAGTAGNLTETLQAAMARSYSANPGERFFTGGGVHLFNNFNKDDNYRSVTVAEALAQSINLVFIRIMRDIVAYTRGTMWENSRQVLKDDNDPRRREVLARFIDKESRVFLSRFWQKYLEKTSVQRLEILLSGLRLTPKRLAVIYRHLNPEAGREKLAEFLRDQLGENAVSPATLNALYDKYSPDAFSLADKGYLAAVHPLELWLLAYLQHSSTPTLSDAIIESIEVRHEVYSWLLRTKAKNARDTRVLTMLEIDAFSEIHRRWQRLGYPFGHLVPSLATALGSSGDKPAALAELIGIIINNGQKLPTYRINQLEFGLQTPYETIMKNRMEETLQVMKPEVAAVLREGLSIVVNSGTARRLAKVFQLDDGRVLMVGGKTGTGDNRIITAHSSGTRISSKARNRTATFVFFLGDRHFGTLTAFVTGGEAADFRFTSALPVQVLKGMAPLLLPQLAIANPPQ